MRLHSEIYIPKRDNKSTRIFHMGVPGECPSVSEGSRSTCFKLFPRVLKKNRYLQLWFDFSPQTKVTSHFRCLKMIFFTALVAYHLFQISLWMKHPRDVGPSTSSVQPVNLMS